MTGSGKVNNPENNNLKYRFNVLIWLALILVLIITSSVFTIFITACGILYYDIKEPQKDPETAFSKKQMEYVNEEETVGGEQGAFIVAEVIDGDTFILGNGERVRLIGINTPEAGMYFYEEAKDVLQIMIEGKDVIFEKDVSERDDYGRLLRYVYYGSLFVNLEMVLRGFANSFTYPPDIKYQDRFLEAERYARNNNLGLWAISSIADDNNGSKNSQGSNSNDSGKSQDSVIEIGITADAKGNDNININGEFILIRNSSNEDFNISGWTIKDSATNTYVFPAYLLEKDSELVLFSGNGTDGDGKFYWGSSIPVWNNDHDCLYLRDTSGLLIKYIAY